MSDAIPKSVLALLRRPWVLPDSYCAFESVFYGPRHAGSEHRLQRQIDPSYYHYSLGLPGNHNHVSDISDAEAHALHRDRALDDFSRRTNNHVAINEHAIHALQDFCREVYAAWQQYRDRLDILRNTCMPIGRMTKEQLDAVHHFFEHGGPMAEFQALLEAANGTQEGPLAGNKTVAS